MKNHFERAASVHARVRNTDPAVVEAIIPCLPRCKRPLEVADIGCGTGRYSKIIAARLDSNLRLFCCDISGAMLGECRKSMCQAFPAEHVHCCLTCANDLPFAYSCFDAVTTFNAIQHFDLDRFVAEGARVLRPGGLLSIYTRTPEQNARTIWGKYFPGFIERETRLYRLECIEEAIGGVSDVQLEGVQEFKHVRIESLESLLDRARNFHYSTFVLYPTEEFGDALETFANTLGDLGNVSKIEHTAENTLVFARKI